MSRFRKAFLAAFLAAGLAGALPSCKSKSQTPPPAQPPAGGLTVTFLDCGQGDAAVIQTPSGKDYLIDAGPNDRMHHGHFDAGEDVVVPFLKGAHIREIQAILITHPHLDHYGGALAVLKNFPVHELIDSGWPSASHPYFKVLKEVESRGIDYRAVKEGETLNWDPALRVDVLGPRPEIYAEDARRENVNNRSIVLKITYKKISFLMSGDAEEEAEAHLVRAFGRKLSAQILKAPHHGSRTSSTEEFLGAVRPELVVISCGRRNPFHHPHPSVLKRLKRLGLKYCRTDLDGTVQVATDGEKFSVKTFGPGGY